jgi:phenylalanyl-tRNA synthetase beta chain
MKAPFALVGANLPGGFKIKKAKLRGVESFGMLCSEQELGMAASAEGLMDLPNDATVGASIRDYLQLDDDIIELDLTPNRGDCLGMMGVAREVAAINGIEYTVTPIESVAATIEDEFPVTLDATADCPAYCGRVVRGINPVAATPLWMQEKLRRAGLRSISPVVDITNYVLIELGQPMHAFDLARLDGGIHVRMAQSGEKLTLLDGKEVELQDDVLVIADERQALAMAGIMGGESSAVGDQTTDIFLEAAYFNPLTIAGRSRRFGLHTDSSHRFERGVDPQLQVRAMERATQLLIEICGGSAGPTKQVQDEACLPQRMEITLRAERVRRMLGIEITSAEIEAYLQRLEIEYSGNDGEWVVKAPAYRFDLSIEADLVEEIARLYGYNNIPETLPVVPQGMVAKPENKLHLDYYKDVLTQRGWQEAITYSFVDPELQDQLGFDRQSISLSNPISSEMSAMRTSHWTGLIQALKYNQHRQQKQIRLFETGLNFIGADSVIDQQLWISGIATGNYWSEQWSHRQRKMDFYDIKGDVEALLAHTRGGEQYRFEAEIHPALHPGQSARIIREGEPVGWLGVMHPDLERQLSLEGPVMLFELSGQALLNARPRKFSPISKFPSIRRDLSLVMDEKTTAEQIFSVIDEIGLTTINKRWVFDVYQGQGVESGRKSVSLGLILLDSSRTLTDEDVEETVSQIIDRLGEKLGTVLRD